MIILDSSFLIAYHNTRDVHHQAAAHAWNDLLKEQWGSVLLPEYVVLEVLTVLARRVDLAAAVEVGEALLHAREIEFIPCTEFFLKAFDLFKNQGNGTLSFVDTAILAIARSRDARFIATFDFGFKGIPDVTMVPQRGTVLERQ